jgi:hypothetical protein
LMILLCFFLHRPSSHGCVFGLLHSSTFLSWMILLCFFIYRPSSHG